MHVPEHAHGTILVVDRNERLPKQRAIFEDAGFAVIVAASAAEGLKVARDQHPDIIVSEVMLEKPDAGFVFGYELKKDAALTNIPLVLLSSIFQATGKVIDMSSPEARRWIKADAYIERPVTADHLLARVCSLLNCPHAMA